METTEITVRVVVRRNGGPPPDEVLARVAAAAVRALDPNDEEWFNVDSAYASARVVTPQQ